MKEYNGDGYDCTCRAQCESECCCGADWTDSEIYELREELADYLKWYKQDKAEIAKLKEVMLEAVESLSDARVLVLVADDLKFSAAEIIAKVENTLCEAAK